jgi:hypothetical protein
MTVRGFHRTVLVALAAVVARGLRPVVPAQLLVARREVAARIRVEVAVRRRETVGAVLGRCAAQTPQRPLQALGQGAVGFPS